jgi:hypothetical protein
MKCRKRIRRCQNRGKVAPGQQPVPELIEVARKVSLKLPNRPPIHASRPLVGLHTFEGVPHFPFGDFERPCLVHLLLPQPVGRWPRLNNAAPLVRSHYRTFIPTTGCPAPVPRIGTLALAVCAACDLSLRIGEQVLTFRTRAWLSFAPPTCRMPLGRASGFPRTDPRGRSSPGFDIA